MIGFGRPILAGNTGAVMPDTQRDVILVGGGHNGLVCATYLAKAGLKVTVLERRHVVGGAALQYVAVLTGVVS